MNGSSPPTREFKMSTRTVAQILASIESTVVEFKGIGFSLEAIQALVVREIRAEMPDFLKANCDGDEYHTHHLCNYVADLFNK
jgi:hypothetical protein